MHSFLATVVVLAASIYVTRMTRAPNAGGLLDDALKEALNNCNVSSAMRRVARESATFVCIR